jgi:hypothetical protein
MAAKSSQELTPGSPFGGLSEGSLSIMLGQMDRANDALLCFHARRWTDLLHKKWRDWTSVLSRPCLYSDLFPRRAAMTIE